MLACRPWIGSRNVDPHRFEQVTPGYALFNVHAGYQRGHLRANAAADNLLNKKV